MTPTQSEIRDAIEVLQQRKINCIKWIETTISKKEDQKAWQAEVISINLALSVLTDLAEGRLVDKDSPNPNSKEPLNYDSTLAYFADQLNIALWKAMELGKYFKGRLVRPEDDDLTAAYMAGFEKGKDSVRPTGRKEIIKILKDYPRLGNSNAPEVYGIVADALLKAQEER